MQQVKELNYNHLIMKPEEVDYIIYHGGCSDGFGCVVSAEVYKKKNFPDKEIIYYPGSFSKLPPDVTDKNVLVCDFSYKKEIMIDLIKQAKKLIILDHHKTAESELKNIPEENKLFNMDYSGAYITWKYFHPFDQVPKLIEYIQDNDLWRKQLPKTLEFTAYMFSLPMTLEEYNKLLDDEYINKEVFLQGSGMVKQNQSNIDNALRHVAPKFMEIGNKYYFVGHVNSSILKSELGNKLFDKYKYCNFSAIYSINDISNSTLFSLRSTEERTDVSEIAKLFGGGGHRNASGIILPTITNTIPGMILDNNKSYYTLSNIYTEEITIENYNYRAVLLNTSHCKYTLGKFLLQNRYTQNEDGKLIQECTYIMRNLNNNNEDYNCDLAVTWNYDGYNDKIWCTLIFNDELNKNKEKLLNIINIFNNQSDYENKSNKITFSTKSSTKFFLNNLFI